MPPTFATTFGHFAISATAGFHAANTQLVIRVDDGKRRLEGRLVGQRQPVRRLGPVLGCLPGPRLFRNEAVQGDRGGETTERVLPCAIEKTPTRDVIHRRYTEADYTRRA